MKQSIRLMKQKILLFALITTILGFIWTSCDKIEEPLELVSDITTSDGFLDTLYIIDSTHVTQKQVLLEDFTGIKCPNCAEAALVAHEWSEEDDHRLIIYGVHAGWYAEPNETEPLTADYRCTTGDEIFNKYVITGWPAGTMNRVEYNGNQILSFVNGEWETVYQLELAKENVIDMKLTNIYFPNLKTVSVMVSANFLQQLDGVFKLVVLIAEDGIISPQANNNPNIGPSILLDYVHHNIIRDAVNSVDGNNVSIDGTIMADKEYLNKFDYQINEAWLTDSTDLNVIAYIYHEASEEVLQTVELTIKMEE